MRANVASRASRERTISGLITQTDESVDGGVMAYGHESERVLAVTEAGDDVGDLPLSNGGTESCLRRK